MYDQAEATDQQPEDAAPLTEKEEAACINKEITENQPDSPTPPVEDIEKGPVPTQQEENVEVIQNSAGDYTKKIYLDPVQRKDKEGKWEDISADLEVNKKEETIEPKNTSIDVAFEQKTEQGTYATVQDEKNKVEYKLEGAEGEKSFTNATDVSAEHKGNQIFYKDVLSNVDLRNTVFDQAIKEDIIL